MNLKNIRKKRGLSQVQLGDKAGVDQSVISKLEQGWDGITLRNLKNISEALNVDVADILSEERTQAEQVLVNAFRTLTPGRRRGWIDMAQHVLVEPEESDQENQ